MTTSAGQPGSSRPGFRTTLIRVLTVQVIALVLLGLLQALYHV